MNGIFAFLYAIFFAGIVNSNSEKEKETKIFTIYWLPFRPALIGLAVGLFFFTFALIPISLILQVWITFSEFLGIITIITCIGVLGYWAPIAWFIRKLQGDSFTVALI
jgi:hypothetical protein